MQVGRLPCGVSQLMPIPIKPLKKVEWQHQQLPYQIALQ